MTDLKVELYDDALRDGPALSAESVLGELLGGMAVGTADADGTSTDGTSTDGTDAGGAGTASDAGLTDTLLVAGPPRSGKTTFALEALERGLHAFGDGGAVMAVSGRHAADALGDRVIHELGSMSQARPVTTLSAIAFRMLTAARSHDGRPLPRLLNGAEQDALLRRTTATHVRHVQAGEPCGTCMLLREYFATNDWSDVVAGTPESAADGNGSRGTRPASGFSESVRGTIPGVNDAFVMQLRDMLSRMDELGIADEHEGRVLRALEAWSPRTERLHVQWRLAFALRREYRQAVADAYPREYRLDSSRLLVEGRETVLGDSRLELPGLVVVDDVQDLTMAGFSFLMALHGRGVGLVLVGNPDESVQAFRGSYPEYLFERIRVLLHPRTLRIGRNCGRVAECRYKDVIASRVSLSIRSPQEEPLPLPERPGKLPALPGSLPIAVLDETSVLPQDGSVDTALYRSAAEELDDVVWRIKRTHLAEGREWNDIAVIAHDNATVRRFGERLRHDGVPVRYSSVTRPLRDESFVRGLFALLELARWREKGIGDAAMSLSGMAALVRSRVVTLMGCPLISVGGSRSHAGRPARLSSVESAMTALGSLAGIVAADGAQASSGALPALMRRWQEMRDAVAEAHHAAMIQTDDAMMDAEGDAGDDMEFGSGALYLLLEFGGAEDTGNVLDAIRSVCGADPHADAFAHLWDLVGVVAKGLSSLPSREPQYALWLAWDACKVASQWQREALNNTEAGRTANDRLDAAMRLFDYAQGTASAEDIVGFIERVRSMRIEADSLAKTAPVDQAVTVTTPAGAAGRHWPLVWMPVLQQGVWPNLAARNTMFGGEDLADVMLHGALDSGANVGGDPQLASVLCAEQKGLLVAVTRADERVTLSAVHNDDLTPSDFLYTYVPERFDRTDHADPQRLEYTDIGRTDRFGGLDSTPRGVVAAARVMLAAAPATGDPAGDEEEREDAVAALRLLSEHGVTAADPRNWPFVPGQVHTGGDADARTKGVPADDAAVRPGDVAGMEPVTLSPSAVDNIWACPVCWLMENRFAGPRAGGVATSFGSLIHEVAQRASEEGLDLPDAFPERSVDGRIDAIRSRMMEIYRELRADPPMTAPVADRYSAAKKDAAAQDVLGRIARYFVVSNTAEYPIGNVGKITVGTLASAECERQFTALFTLDDVLAAYNAIDGIEPVGRGELMAIMGTLVGGWPEAMHERIAIRLTGRMDRVEHRVTPNGELIRLIDYKTGGAPSSKAIFNDLQLVCYQLGLAFPEHGPRGLAALRAMPNIGQSALFHVGEKDWPSQSRGAESLYQPPLFAGGGLNATVFAPRYFIKDQTKVVDIPALDERPPQGVDGDAWHRFLSLRGTQAVWSLTMISRVFYAAAASQSAHLEAHPQNDHVKWCRLKTVCPACAGQMDTIFETRQA